MFGKVAVDVATDLFCTEVNIDYESIHSNLLSIDILITAVQLVDVALCDSKRGAHYERCPCNGSVVFDHDSRFDAG